MPPSKTLTILALADLHYVHLAGQTCSVPTRLGRLGLELAMRAIEDAQRLCRPDVIVLLGDLVDDGNAPNADQDTDALAEALAATDTPIIVVPGNHDTSAEKVLNAFGDTLGPHDVNGYCLYTFADPYEADDSTTRPRDRIDAFLQTARPKATIAIQHNPIYPPIESDYPYLPRNATEIIDAYTQAGGILSLSGHYHAGQDPIQRGGTTYLTCATLTQTPFAYYLIRVNGREVRIKKMHVPFETPAP